MDDTEGSGPVSHELIRALVYRVNHAQSFDLTRSESNLTSLISQSDRQWCETDNSVKYCSHHLYFKIQLKTAIFVWDQHLFLAKRSANGMTNPSVCRLSVVCDVRAAYSVGLTFRRFFAPYCSLAIRQLIHQKSRGSSKEITPNGGVKCKGVGKSCNFRPIAIARKRLKIDGYNAVMRFTSIKSSFHPCRA